MNIENIKSIINPVSKQMLNIANINKQIGNSIQDGILSEQSIEQKFYIEDGILDIIYPRELIGFDKDFNDKYQEVAAQYDEGMKWLFDSFFEEEEKVRVSMVNLLELKENDFVLNLGCGTGSDSIYILKKLGEDGKLFNLDLSKNLLKIAIQKLSALDKKTSLDYIAANASFLPFPDNTFDKVFHFGGLNMFTHKKKAIQEITRVTKPNGRIVIGDESAAPWLRNKLYGKIIRNANPLYNNTPPLNLIPRIAENVSLHYVLGNAFYLISYKKGEAAKINLDLPIPGRRGGTLRFRFNDSYKKKI